MNKIKYLLLLILCCSFTFTYAQKRISGRVWSPQDGPAMMANVLEVDANNRIQASTTTDMNGNFSMVIKNTNDMLKVAYIGYRPWESKIGGTTIFKIQLESNVKRLGPVTKKAYRKVKSNGLSIPEREVSVATQTLDMDEMKGLSFESADQALQGQIAGLDVVANSGNLGSGMSMRLRGVTSISGNQDPLIVVDGHILENYSKTSVDLQDMDNTEQFANLLNVNVEDIKSIEVKKDASACAIWGARGSNGVIEITTRRGVKGKTKISGNYYFTGSWQPSGMKMLNGDGYTMMLKEAYFNPQQSDLTSNIVELSYKRDRTAYYANYNKNTDWVDAVTQLGQSHKYYVTINGGGDQAQFRISGGYDHETGTIIKQSLDRFSTRMTLDYIVSDRITFSSNFALTYTKNNRNYTDILARAYASMPNKSITRWEYDPNTNSYYDTGEYFKMYPAANGPGNVQDGQTSYYLRDQVDRVQWEVDHWVGYGNPVAIANYSWSKVSDYTITPQFQINYKLLGKTADKTMLDYQGEVYMNATSSSSDAYYPAILSSDTWTGNINRSGNSNNRNLAFTTTHYLTFTPKLPKDHTFMIMGRAELNTSTGNSQSLATKNLVGGITDPTVNAYLTGASTSTSKDHSLNFSTSMHYSFKSKYALDFTLRADGSTSFGKDNRWGYFPSISGRWNISDELFFQPLKKYVDLLSFAPGWGVTGNSPSTTSIIYNKYSNNSAYGFNGNYMSAISPDNLRLTTVRWEKTKSWNLGFRLNLLQDLLMFDVNIYGKRTSDLLQRDVAIPTSVGYSKLDYDNVGSLKNNGWELNMSTKDVFKTGKFSMKFRFNASQNHNRISSMDASVLSGINGDFDYKNENYLSRVQIGNALYSIYGFRYKGVYRYGYDHSGYFADETKNALYGSNTAAAAAARGENATCPIARDANGNIIFDADGNPLRMYYNYGSTNYQFAGGDVIYEDINHDGQINELDIVYLGNSNPKFNGGFGVDFKYGNWTLKTSFNIRTGAKVVDRARMHAEDMRSNQNQSRAVNWRWRKNGDITEIPRAMNEQAGTSFNALASDRYVENSDFVRLQYLQLTYNFNPSFVKRWGLGLRNLSFACSANNLFCLTKYKGVDPEHAAYKYSPAFDDSQTPVSRSVTFSVNFSF
ncbi:MAG: SusC/RagA family TonB-linked outer membrane protein [Bacteroidaceae bacterium]